MLSLSGTYTILRHKTLPYEIQANIRPCNLHRMCICALAIQSGNSVATFDVCTRGYMRTWAKKLYSTSNVEMTSGNQSQERLLGLQSLNTANKSKNTDDIEVLSIDDGRIYQINIGDKFSPSSSVQVMIGPLLTYVKVTVSSGNKYNTLGLCGTFDGNIRNEYMAVKYVRNQKQKGSSGGSISAQVTESICAAEDVTSKGSCSGFLNAWR